MIDYAHAQAYNSSVMGRLWLQAQLPAPLGDARFPPSGTAFAAMVAVFQRASGLTIDGKLGPMTLATLRAQLQSPAPTSELDPAGDDTEDGMRASAPQEQIPSRLGVSNALRIGGISVPLSEELLSRGFTASNFVDDEEHRFVGRARTPAQTTSVVHHESVTRTQLDTVNVLIAKKRRSAQKGQNGGQGWDYGVHLIVAPDGHISCHADLVTARLVHAHQLNDTGIGIEWVNPYHPKFARPPFTEVMPGAWWTWKPKGEERLYTLPTPAQLDLVPLLCRYLSEVVPTVPLAFPTSHLNARRPRIRGWDQGKKPGPGHVAHRDFAGHSDGRYLLEHAMSELLG